MTDSNLVIEKLNVAVFVDNDKNANAFLYQISEKLKETVLPQVEKKISELGLTIDVNIDHLNLEFDLSDMQDLAKTLGNSIATELADTYKKERSNRLPENETNEKLDVLLETSGFRMGDSKDNFFADTFFQFLKTGYFSSVHNLSQLLDGQEIEMNFAEIENYWLKSDKKEQLFGHLTLFLGKSDRYRLRFLNQVSSSFLNEFIFSLCADPLTHFLHIFYQFNDRNDQLSAFFLKKVLELANSGQKINIKRFAEKLNTKSTQFRDLLHEKINKIDDFDLKNHEIIQLLMKNPNSHNSDSLAETIKSKSEHALFVFIQYLRSDLSLREKLDAELIKFYKKRERVTALSNWSYEFANSIHNRQTVTGLLIELEELKPINGQVKKPEFFATELADLIQALEKRHTQVDIDDLPQPLNKNSNVEDSLNALVDRLVDKNIPIANAGIILLNPFFPALFKNLKLQNQLGEWHSDKHQALCVYMLNYLTNAAWETSEDQLLLGKIVTGYDLEEILPPFKDLEESLDFSKTELTEQLSQKEIPNILTALQENWRPMRNCTWEGLKNDFLIRPGTLTQKENLQYVLTVEPHALDIMLPHKNWGHSMVKYSWMDEVLHVEWGQIVKEKE